MALSVNAAEKENESGVVGVAADGFWMLESGVEGEGEMDVPPASPSSSRSCGDDSLALRVLSSEVDKNASPLASALCGDFAVGVLAWPFTVGLESGCLDTPADEPSTRPLLVPSPVMFKPSPRLSSVDCGSATAADVFPVTVSGATEEASTRGSANVADSWSVLLLPTFIILDSVDLRLDTGGMGAYSCADGTGGGKNGDPGDGKGDDEDSLLMVTVSEGVSEKEGGWEKGSKWDARMDSPGAQTFCLRGDDSRGHL